MIKRTLLPIILFSMLSFSATSQGYSYTHYDIADGLAGSVVYCITQDKDGFIWTGTETGVSRFDGTHFKNFAVADGLPDVEVLEMFADSKGRVWMAPFLKSVCYYYKGRIYNQDNDSLLHAISLKGNVESFAEDAAGNIMIQERTALHLFAANGTVRQYDSIGGHPIHECANVSRSASGHFLVEENQQVFLWSEQGSVPFCSIQMAAASPNFIAMNPGGMICRATPYQTVIHLFSAGKTLIFPFEQAHYKHISFSTSGDSLFYINEIAGATEYNSHTGQVRQFLPGKEISRTFRDAAGNTWFTTLGQGIFRLNSNEVRTIRLSVPGMEESAVCSIKRLGNLLMVGDNHNYIFEFSLPDMRLRQRGSLMGGAKSRTMAVNLLPSGNLLIASDHGFDESSPVFRRKATTWINLKAVFPKNSNELFFSSNWGVGLFNVHDFRVTDTLWRERSTSVFYRKDTVYIGTLKGLFEMAPDKSVTFLGRKIPFLRNRISTVTESADGTLWIASYDAGVIGYKDGQVTATITQKSGLTSDLCRTMFVDANSLWIGTDKGLNKIDLNQAGYPITQFSANDGLGSDMINSVYADSSVIYVGTSSGLSYFDDRKLITSENCRLHLLSLINSGKERIGDTSNLLIPFSDKHMRIEFAGISYRSAGRMDYRYRLMGLDSSWRHTRESFLEFPTLPSGSYEFQLQAINKFGVRSSILSLPIMVATPFWQTLWFYCLIILGFLLLTWLIFSLRIKSIRRRQKEKEELNQQIMEMEHIALQGQMNPHFIFNCLNSIQQYIFDHEFPEANKYLTGFSRLIRSTLSNSSKSFVPLTLEIDYLATYLSLEKLRFKEKMDYSIEVDPSVDSDILVIPPMLIQPYIENSMRHGLRHKKNGKGYISVRFMMTGGRLTIAVEDNGIGRKKAAGFRTSEHIEYQSKGMSLTAERVRMMNEKYKNGISIEVIDLGDDKGEPCGTRVVMQFPLFHANYTLNAYDSDRIG
jgi:ligand-binding sensor domain-containing protein